MTTTIRGARALVTGAGRGLGKVFSETLIARGAATVYGAARDPSRVTAPGVTPVRLDITNPVQVAAAVWSITANTFNPFAPSRSVSRKTVSATDRGLTLVTTPGSLWALSPVIA